MSAVLALELLVGFGCSPHCVRRVLGLLPNGAHNGFLAHMGFGAIIKGEPRLMDARVFADGLMGLKDDLLTVPLEARFAYDTERNTFFLNMEGMSLRICHHRPDGRNGGLHGEAHPDVHSPLSFPKLKFPHPGGASAKVSASIPSRVNAAALRCCGSVRGRTGPSRRTRRGPSGR
jgi:hypothetical protein